MVFYYSSLKGPGLDTFLMCWLFSICPLPQDTSPITLYSKWVQQRGLAGEQRAAELGQGLLLHPFPAHCVSHCCQSVLPALAPLSLGSVYCYETPAPLGLGAVR